MNTNTGDTFEIPQALRGVPQKTLEDAMRAERRDFQAKMDPGAVPMKEATAAKVGFRELTDMESALVQNCRRQGESLESMLALLESENVDKRWLAIARTHFQEGLMAAVRSVTKPAFF